LKSPDRVNKPVFSDQNLIKFYLVFPKLTPKNTFSTKPDT
jgi:hypothetical protein